MNRPARSVLVYLAALAASAFVLNWLWEMAQMPAFAEMAGRSWRETALPCMRAAAGDIGLTLPVFGLGALAAGRLRWGAGRDWYAYLAAALLGLVVAAAFEQWSLANGRWTYTDRMPVVPVLGVGLWPLLQLALLTPASVRIAWWFAGRNGRAAREGAA